MVKPNSFHINFPSLSSKNPLLLPYTLIQLRSVYFQLCLFTSFGFFANVCSSWSSSMHSLSLEYFYSSLSSISKDSSSMICFLLSPFSIIGKPAVQWSPSRNYSCVSYSTNEPWYCFLPYSAILTELQKHSVVYTLLEVKYLNTYMSNC